MTRLVVADMTLDAQARRLYPLASQPPVPGRQCSDNRVRHAGVGGKVCERKRPLLVEHDHKGIQMSHPRSSA